MTAVPDIMAVPHQQQQAGPIYRIYIGVTVGAAVTHLAGAVAPGGQDGGREQRGRGRAAIITPALL